MEKIKISYIDDLIDTNLSKYLDNYSLEGYEIESMEIKFKTDKGYESLLNNSNIRISNIVLIDSKLFENNNANQGKFTGEEFKIILKKYFPFIEVIVITQNAIEPGYETISKYDSRKHKDVKEYYDEVLSPKIKDAIKNICEFRKIASVIEKNDNLEKVLIEKIINLLNGTREYQELTKTDIDKIVDIFKEVQEKING